VSTRALNVRVPVSTVTGPYNDENMDDSEKVSEKEHGFADAHSAVNDDGLEPDPDLDPASLRKAFRFAAWSSVALVRSLSRPPASLISIDSNDSMPSRLLFCSFWSRSHSSSRVPSLACVGLPHGSSSGSFGASVLQLPSCCTRCGKAAVPFSRLRAVSSR
jgi:hypothetical protein